MGVLAWLTSVYMEAIDGLITSVQSLWYAFQHQQQLNNELKWRLAQEAKKKKQWRDAFLMSQRGVQYTFGPSDNNSRIVNKTPDVPELWYSWSVPQWLVYFDEKFAKFEDNVEWKKAKAEFNPNVPAAGF